MDVHGNTIPGCQNLKTTQLPFNRSIWDAPHTIKKQFDTHTSVDESQMHYAI